ncbi:ufm1-specific protease 2 isoform X1 [Procambarus clarkii]|uniref:ufm1-specific protease 2 isoform X1 n=2 Tax=Procambarus clarkii TaxID=6728 RepID=UPI0037431709
MADTHVNMELRLCLLSQLLKRLQNQHDPTEGEVFGLTTNEGQVIAVALVAKSEALKHDLSLLLPVPLTCIGRFQVCKGNHAEPTLEEGQFAIIWDQQELHIYMQEEQGVSTGEYIILSQEEFNEIFILAKVHFSLDLSSKNTPSSIRNVIQSLTEQLESPSACFRLQNSNLLLQNSEEGILSLGGSVTDGTETVGSAFKGSGKKKTSHQVAAYQLMLNRSSVELTDAPVIRIDNRNATVLSTIFNGEAIVYLEKSTQVCYVAELLAQGVTQQLQLAEFWMKEQLSDKKLHGTLTSLNSLHYISGHVVNVIYPDDVDERYLETYRKAVHKALVFPFDRPMMRRANRLTPAPGSKSAALTNTHVGLKPSTVDGDVRIVPGTYGYHHYMQNRFDDNKWGCAYRSLQTLVSWFRYQGYTEKPIPTHADIQKCLVDISDKPSSFLGSRQWIGSTEVGYVLDSMFNISSKFIFVSSGAELANKGRDLSIHFETQGTPIMIGGGVLAHTIIGVDWNAQSGDISFLILDPHYTGSEDLSTIQNKGWCGWKGPDFWDPAAYYNLCLPQRPSCI